MSDNLRDDMAMAALPAILADWYADGAMAVDHENAKDISEIAYVIADAMLEARK